MNGHPPESAKPKPPRRWRMMGPGLALLVLGGTGLYGLLSRTTAAPSATTPPGAPMPQAHAPAPRPTTLATKRAETPAVAPAVTEPGKDEARVAKEQREAARQSAREYRAGRFNAFFRKEVFVEELTREGGARIVALRNELADPTALQQLPPGAQFLETKPEPVLERMAMIDLLFELAPQEPTAREAMTSLALTPIDSSLPDSVKKGLVGEKYDLLFRLAQVDRQLAVDTYSKLENPRLKDLLREALFAGLAESGAPPDEVRRMTAHL
ncbi:hypothetical protein [Myxococcus qinghaiensis]|uniref:hypothetical protein n=1 Tax=Myxococcus qinghaiensis TaxID=2906758 RepID=UPI0020A816A3|nr:hypothetical protein [Myxococcus qinghaiensis]MCP3163577.1 hypothetical protein [Myxococcus qinghaiensis]